MHGLRRSFCFGVLAIGVACSSRNNGQVDGGVPPGSGGPGIATASGAGGSGGIGGSARFGTGDTGLGGAGGRGGAIASGGGSASPTGGGGMVGSGGDTRSVVGSGGESVSRAGSGGTGSAVDAATGGVVGSGGQSADSGDRGGGFGNDVGGTLDGRRSETTPPFPTCGDLKGTLGGAATAESSMQRNAITGKDCRKYVVQNNNFANPTGSVQTLTYSGSSFRVIGSTASSASDASSPASFPSIYIGANGPIANGAYSTWDDSNLPIQVSAISSMQTTFRMSGGAPEGDFAATIELWFAKAKPIAGSYAAALSGSLMIWLGKPGTRQPFGERIRQASIGGHSWEVWVRPHGSTAAGTDDAARPLVSYVVQDGPLSALEGDLAAFIIDAAAYGETDKSAGGTSQAFAKSWYLTDVMAGFQIWTGSDAAGLECTRFECRVK